MDIGIFISIRKRTKQSFLHKSCILSNSGINSFKISAKGDNGIYTFFSLLLNCPYISQNTEALCLMKKSSSWKENNKIFHWTPLF